jgi:hypothetical protein
MYGASGEDAEKGDQCDWVMFHFRLRTG